MPSEEEHEDAREASGVGGRRFVVVIGIDQYAAWPRLANAVSDARGALEIFTRLGFEAATEPLLNERATDAAVKRLVQDDLASKLSENDQLVVFFAGHGHTVTRVLTGTEVKTGYLIPADADAVGGRVATWIRLDSWLSDVARLPPRHILVIIDACRSGIALGSAVTRWRGEEPVSRSMRELKSRRSRRIITSALDDQRAIDGGPVPGHSLFTGFLIEGLSRDLATRSRHRYTTGSELGIYLQQQVSRYKSSEQTPDFGTLELDDRGEMLLPLLQDGAREPESPAPPPAPDVKPAWTRRVLAVAAVVLAGSALVLVGIKLGKTPDNPVGPSRVQPAPDKPIDAATDASESRPERIRRLDPFVARGNVSIQSHPVTRAEYDGQVAMAGSLTAASLSFGEADELCNALGGRLPLEGECSATASSDVWIWGAKGGDRTVLVCRGQEGPLYVSVDKRPNKPVGVQCVR